MKSVRQSPIFIICCLLVTLAPACHNLNNLNNTKTFAFDLEGHRGCRGWMPENTIPAMLKAIDLGVNTLEMDVVITKDSQVVVSHDPFFNHEISTKPDGSAVSLAEETKINIYQMDYAEVKRYDVGLRGNARFPQQQKMAAIKPTLSDLVDAAEQYVAAHKKKPIRYNIEIKSLAVGDNIFHPLPAPFTEMVMAIINQKNMKDRAVLQSFDIRPLQYLHAHYPDMTTALLVEDFDKKPYALQLQELGFIPQIYSPHYSLVTPLLVKQCKDMNVRLIPWTVNDASKIEELKTMGVSGIITDYPMKGIEK